MSGILVISTHFPPRQAAGVYRTLRFVRYLPELDWQVHVLTIEPDSYEAGVAIDNGLLRKVPDEISVHRTRAVYPLQWFDRAKGLFKSSKSTKARPTTSAPAIAPTPSNGNGHRSKSGIIQRAKDMVTLPLMTPDRNIGWIPFAVRRGTRLLNSGAIHAMYSSGPPWSNHLVGLQLKKRFGTSWVADFRDPWVGNNFRANRRGEDWVGRRHRRLERAVVERADRLVLNTDRARDDMRSRHPDIPAEKFVVITNGYDPADYASVLQRPEQRTMDTAPRSFVMAHAGTFYGQRSVKSFLEALSKICHEGRIPREGMSIELIGAQRSGRTTEQTLVEQLELQDVVRILPSVPHAECLKRLASADVLLLVQTEAPLCIPGKLFEYIALGRPVFTLSGPGATVDLIQREQLGICVDPEDPVAIGDGLVKLYEQLISADPPSGASPETFHRYDGRLLTCELNNLLRTALQQQPIACPNPVNA